MMTDGLNLHWRGYPVTLVSDGVMRLLDGKGGLARLAEVLGAARDTAGPGEPADWMFKADLDGTAIWIERHGGVRDSTTGRHEGGQWSVYLPDER